MGVLRSRSKSSKRRRRRQRRKATLSVGGDRGGDDLISALTDDLLVRILELVPDARDVVRTGVLSRRWRGLWTGVIALRFNSGSCPAVRREAVAAQHYLAFINDALTLRAKARCYAVKDVTISFNVAEHETEELVRPSLEAAQGWIRYAVQHEVKSLVLDLYLPLRGSYVDRLHEQNAVALDDLASSAKMETMHLTLGGTKLRLPASSSSTVVFSNLTDLSLRHIRVAGHLLSRLVSAPCCPRLRKLQLTLLEFPTMEELLLEGDKLLEVSIDDIEKMQSLKLRTPSLRVLHVELCSSDLAEFTVSAAPKLEDLMFEAQEPLSIVDVHDHLSCVETLEIQLQSHGYYYEEEQNDNDTSFHLLQCCRLTKSLKVSLEVKETKYRGSDIIKGRVPPLTHVTSLTIQATQWESHFFAASIASLLAQCNNIRYLSLQLFYWFTKLQDTSKQRCSNWCQWKSHEFTLPHLQELELKKLAGTNCEFRFIQSILARETGIRKVAISFDPCCGLQDKTAFELMPPLKGGLWTTCNDANLSYKWRRSSLAMNWDQRSHLVERLHPTC